MTFQPRIHENGDVCCAAYDATTGEPIPSPSQCEKCTAYFAALEANSYAPPDSYGLAFAKLRAAASNESTFEASYKAERLRDLEATRAELDAYAAAHPSTPLTDEDIESYQQYAAPNGYDIALTAQREKRR